MTCTNCGDKISGVCKVCELLDGDDKVKVVTFCGLCQVYICKDCYTDLDRRLKAFLKAKF
jgi:mRNA deadenylase 3'-5' endonuclease subunit Ccr4